MSPESLAVRLIPFRSTWAIIRMTWMPLLLGVAMLPLAKVLASVSAIASLVLMMAMGPLLIAGVLYVGLRWRHGSELTIADGQLMLGERRAPVTAIRARRGQHVFRSHARYAGGTYWSPLLTIEWPEGEPVRIVCLGAGGPARGRKPGGAPDFQLDQASWDALALRLSAGA